MRRLRAFWAQRKHPQEVLPDAPLQAPQMKPPDSAPPGLESLGLTPRRRLSETAAKPQSATGRTVKVLWARALWPKARWAKAATAQLVRPWRQCLQGLQEKRWHFEAALEAWVPVALAALASAALAARKPEQPVLASKAAYSDRHRHL